MAAGRIFIPSYTPAFDRNGELVSGARMYVYANRTTTLVPIFSDSGLTTPTPNPVEANASGQFPSVWVDGGTEDALILYSLAITGPDGQNIGNPYYFDDYNPLAGAGDASEAGAIAGAIAGEAAGTIAGAAAAEEAVAGVAATKANTDGSNINSDAFRTVLGAGRYAGTWNASTNTPIIVSGEGLIGDFYTVSVGGNTTIDGQNGWLVGDQIWNNGFQWVKIDAPVSAGTGIYRGAWDASANTPNIVSGEGRIGDFYTVSVAGTTEIDGNTDWSPGEQIWFDGLAWQKIAAAGSNLGGTNKGPWDANTNTPALANGVGKLGDFYTVSVAGTTNIDGTATWVVGDQIWFNGTVWQRIQSPDSNKLPIDGTGATAPFLINVPYVQAAGTDQLPRSTQSRLSETISVKDFSTAGAAGTEFNRAFVASGGARNRAVVVPPGTYNVDVTPIVGNVTKILTGKVDWTGSQGNAIAANGKIIQFSGLAPDFPGETNFSDPFYVGPINRPGLIDYQISANRLARYMGTAQLVGYNPVGLTGVMGISDTGTGTGTTYTEGCIGGMFLALNRRTTAQIPTTGTGCYAIYAEAVRWPNAGRTHVIEIDNINWGTVVPVTPSNPFRHGITTGIWAMNGGDAAGGTQGAPNASSVCIMIGANGARWNNGIVFHTSGLVDRGGGFGEAIAFGVNHSVVQYNNSEAIVNRIDFAGTTTGNGTRMLFNESGWALQDFVGNANRLNVSSAGFGFGPLNAWMNYVGSTSTFRVGAAADPVISSTATTVALRRTTDIGGITPSLKVQAITSAVNYLEVQGSVTGNAVLARALGTDTNIDFSLQAKGTGRIRFGTFTSNADAPVTGYITIKDASGVERKLAVIA